ncbi:MAG: ribonuclease HII [Peptococcaceae bacterium]|nr:ribonuclease HII [Peptococcaceae bacterium]
MYKSMSIEQVRALAAAKDFCFSPEEVALLRQDPRKGTQDVLLKVQRRREAHLAEEERLNSITQTELDLWGKGFKRLVGIDEVGRGPLAGPVTVGGVIFAEGSRIPGVNDSKALSPKRREELAHIIKDKAIAWAIASRDSAYIDQHGIMLAIYSCQLEIVEKLAPDYLMLDAFLLPGCSVPQLAIVKGDSKSLSIAAGSIIAKVHRDQLMVELGVTYPGYGFASHKGYGCREHYDALFSLGPCEIHRQSYLGFMKDPHE